MKPPRTVLPRHALLALAPAVVLTVLTGGTCAQSKEQSKKGDAAPAAAARLVEEKGKFRILLDTQQVGSEEFQISPEGGNAAAKEWTAHGATEIHLPDGSTARITGRLKLAPDGTPLRYEWSVSGQKKASAVVEFQGGTAKIALQLEGAKPFIQELSFGSGGEPGRTTPRVLILDNNLYHQYAVLARLYDWTARGPQTFPVLIPQDMTPGSITVESLGRVDGAPVVGAQHAAPVSSERRRREPAEGLAPPAPSVAEGSAAEPRGPVPGFSRDVAPLVGAQHAAPVSLSGAEPLELLRVRTPDVEISLYLDSSHRLVRLAVPASKVVILRE